ncbi:MAG: metallophosphoesterase [bacterium]|nr:metallophosphoesterase [bacterium]
MLRLIHCADLHLSEREREYCLAVFEEIIDQANRRDVAAVLISGDFFDTYADAEALRGEVREIAAKFSGEILYIPGNHEELQSGVARKSKSETKSGSKAKPKAKSKSASPGGDSQLHPIEVLDLSPITVIHHAPCTFLERMYTDVAVEIVAIPHQAQYGDYQSWNIPAKRAPLRLAMAHGIVTGLAYAGPDEEAGAGMLDPLLFNFHSVDYAALGHIHARRLERHGGTVFCYPGSTRVWRRGESGERGFALLSYDPRTASLQPEFVPVECAGVYREIAVPLSLTADSVDSVELRDDNAWHTEDYVELRLSGLVEDERAVADLIEQLRSKFEKSARRFEIRRDDVEVLPGISSEPMVRKFLDLWEQREPVLAHAHADEAGEGAAADARKNRALQIYERDRAVWFRSREIALLEIKRLLDSRSR